MSTAKLNDLLIAAECSYCDRWAKCLELADDGGAKPHCACVDCVKAAFADHEEVANARS
jgi:hypothetical protein